MGLSRSSANVRTRYVDIRYIGTTGSGETVPWSSAGEAWPSEPNIMIRYPRAATNIPRPILTGADGSLSFLASAAKMAIEIGVRNTT